MEILTIEPVPYEYIHCYMCDSYDSICKGYRTFEDEDGPDGYTGDFEFQCVECRTIFFGATVIRHAMFGKPTCWMGVGSRFGGV